MRAGVGFALIVAILAALMVNALSRQATDQLSGHYATRTGDVETDALPGGRAKSAIGFHNHKSTPSFLSQGSGGSF